MPSAFDREALADLAVAIEPPNDDGDEVGHRRSGAVRVTDPVYQRGVKFLLGTQFADGSWHVRSRALAIQPIFDIGFPHGANSWISAAGTNWATTLWPWRLAPPRGRAPHSGRRRARASRV